MNIQLSSISKTFNQRLILNQIDFQAESGKLIHIVGGNGSGKSTIFKIICQIIEPDSGTVFLSDDVNLGALIENPSFIEDRSIKANLSFLGKIKKQFNEERVINLVSRLGLDYDNKLKLSKYSLGMRQKVGIIQAIMENQNVILLDEPTRGLDKEALAEFNKIIGELIEESKTIIIASHDNLADLQFDEYYSLEEGRLQSS
ncbi:hypothetical protein RV11_GL001248 [Enterococcus phoeniculicola]|uniref:ABC transporter domain-containing protein n=1 Tax=Enterococcus phoeniculicola ATCC BAA-412 TaxID=1158610 RepID=R3WF12_9ENTE|nr:ABC transporter ATP-binding protein [Enterococcus phoeniculicola]EOL46027.1 hypothetical protein UC3_00832 [Enterococcus phoeniculicola ATCC BAA-412]EOT77128.1 hypothetical protein I589_02090 [Enterococcus phoeniculicola ATCC BAA-412]OJG73468.1 hypothetical protein RV11_GL001248 [Enterococcus phoeniculicola]